MTGFKNTLEICHYGINNAILAWINSNGKILSAPLEEEKSITYEGPAQPLDLG